MNKEVLKLQLIEKQLLSRNNLMEDLTDSEYRIFRSLALYIDKYGYSPALSNIANELGISKQAVSKFFKILERKGYIKRRGYSQIELTYKDANIAIENVEKLRPVLEELKSLLDLGLITEKDYQAKKKQILSI